MVDLGVVDTELSGCFFGGRSEETTAGFRDGSFGDNSSSSSSNRSSGCRSRSSGCRSRSSRCRSRSSNDDVGLRASRPGLGSGRGRIGRLVEKESRKKRRRLRKGK